jgi:hypothetical protein
VPHIPDDNNEPHQSESAGSSPRAHESGGQNDDRPDSPR